MNYIFDVEKLKELLLIQEKIYDCFNRILKTENKTENFYKLIGKIEKLSLKEDELISNLPYLIPSLERICASIRISYLSESNDIVKSKFVLSRFDNIISERCADLEDDTLDVDFFERQSLFNEIKNHYYISFIKKMYFGECKDDLNNFMKELGLIGCYCKKNISDMLVHENFDFSMFKTDSFIELIKKLNVDPDMFSSMYYESLYNECIDVLTDMTVNYDFYYDNGFYKLIAYNVSLLKFLLVNISDNDYQNVRMLFNDDLSKSNFESNSIPILFDIFESVQCERYPSELYDHEKAFLDIDNIIAFIKLEKVILDNFNKEEIDNRVLLNLFEYEKEIKSLININEDNVDQIFEIIDKDIELFIEADEKSLYLIKNRIFNLFKEFSDLSPYIISKNYDMILSNHLIRTVYLMNNKDICSDIKYLYPNVNWNYLMDYSDEVSSIMLGLNSVLDYSYDKSEQLYYLGVSLISELCDMEGKASFNSIFDFKIKQFDDIINNVSDEHLYLLRDEVINSSLSISSKFEKLKNLERRYIV